MLWCAVTIAVAVGHDPAVLRSSAVTWLCLAVSSAHFVSSYPLAYGAGARGEADPVRSHPVALVWAPLMLGFGAVAVIATSLAGGVDTTAPALRLAITGVLVMTIWHAVKQVYGVARLGAALAGIPLSHRTVMVLRFGLYPLWFSAVAALFGPGGYAVVGGYEVGASVLPGWFVSLVHGVAEAAAVALAVVLVHVCVRARRLPGLLVAPYLAWSLWLLAAPAAAPVVIVTGLHGLQYLVCVKRAEVATGRSEAGTLGRRTWWAEYVLGAAAIGVLVATWMPPVVDRALGFSVGASTGVVAAVVFVVLNAHHYLIDAVVWRSDGRHVRAIVGRR